MTYYKHYFESGEIEGSAQRIQAKNDLVYGLLLPHIGAGSKVLELGVGKGYFARTCIDKGHEYEGIESNAEQCEALVESGLNVSCAEVPPVKANGEEYGLVYSAHLLEHLPDSRAVHALLVDCAELAKPGGVVAMLFPDASVLKGEFWDCDYTHLYPTTGRRISQAMDDAGLRVVENHHLHGHYTGSRQLLARVGSRPLFLHTARAFIRNGDKRDLFYRGWMYLQRDVLLIAVPRQS